MYDALIEQMNTSHLARVVKDKKGDYEILSTDGSHQAYNERKAEIGILLSSLIGQQRPVQIGGTNYPFEITFEEIENLLILQFSRFFLFNEVYSLTQELPSYITLSQVNGSQQNDLFKVFISYLGPDAVRRFLVSRDPDEKSSLLNQLQGKANDLTNKVNGYRTHDGDHKDLVEIVLYPSDGIQITMKTDGKKSFYSHLSDNTKFLFAYNLYQEVYDIEEDILLFDEPNNGFHSTAQAFLLDFLKFLTTKRNLVIVSTHSEYLIDLDRLSGVRIMSVDANKNVIVKNHIYSQKNKGDYLALQPILDAIGLNYANQINLRDKIIITEGITDMLYVRAFNRILGYDLELNIAPARGDSVILPLIPFLIAQGVAFKVVIDKGRHKAKIQREYDIGDEYFFEIPVPETFKSEVGWSGIEDLFSKRDFEQIVLRIHESLDEDYYQVTNSAYAKDRSKRLMAQAFYEQLEELRQDQFDSETADNFRHLLDYCQTDVWFHI